MSVCALCGLWLLDESGLCAYHHVSDGDDWAASNRVMCDFIHRKRIAPQRTFDGRSDGIWAEWPASWRDRHRSAPSAGAWSLPYDFLSVCDERPRA